MKGKKGKKEKGKLSMGSNFSNAIMLSPPFGYVALSHWACILVPLPSFILQLPSPSCCVWSQLSFFFLPFILNLCRTMSTVISPSPPPPLACTLAIPHHHHHQPHHCHLNTAATS